MLSFRPVRFGAALLVVVVGLASCSDSDVDAATSRSSTATSTATSPTIPSWVEPTSASSSPSTLPATTTTAFPTTTSTIEPEAGPSLVAIDDGRPVLCTDRVNLRNGGGTILGSVAGATVLDLDGGLDRNVSVFSSCGDELLISTGTWSWGEFIFDETYLAPDGASAGMRFDWQSDPPILREPEYRAEFPENTVELPTRTPMMLSIARTNGYVSGHCGEPSLALGAFISGPNNPLVPWEVDGVQLVAFWHVGEFVANDRGEFAFEAYVCTDDGSASGLVMGTFDVETGALLDFRELTGFTARHYPFNHSGPTGVALGADGDVLILIKVSETETLEIEASSLCDNAGLPRPAGHAWALFSGDGELRPQLHRCKDGALQAISDVGFEQRTSLWAADANSDGNDEVFLTNEDGSLAVFSQGDGYFGQVSLAESGRFIPKNEEIRRQRFRFGCVEGGYAQIEALKDGLEAKVSFTEYRIDGIVASVHAEESMVVAVETLFKPDGYPLETALPFEERFIPCS